MNISNAKWLEEQWKQQETKKVDSAFIQLVEFNTNFIFSIISRECLGIGKSIEIIFS